MPGVARLGNMTYPLYLVHTWVSLWVISVLGRAEVPASLRALLAVACSIAVAWVTNRWLEPPMRRAAQRAFDRVVPETAALGALTGAPPRP